MAGLRLCFLLLLQVSSVAVIVTTGAVVQEQDCSAANADCKDDLAGWTDDAEQVSRVEFREKESNPLSLEPVFAKSPKRCTIKNYSDMFVFEFQI